MSDNKDYKFYSRNNIMVSTLIFILFVVFISMILYLVLNNKLNPTSPGGRIAVLLVLSVLSVLSIVTLLLFLMLIKVICLLFRIGYYYKLNNKGLVISSLLLKKEVKFNEIKDVKILSSRNVKALVFKLYKQEKPSDLFPAPIPKSKQLREINRYNTDAIGYGISYRDIGFGTGLSLYFPEFMSIKLLKPIVSKKEFILITLKNNTQHLLSPRKIPEFFNTYKKLKKCSF